MSVHLHLQNPVMELMLELKYLSQCEDALFRERLIQNSLIESHLFFLIIKKKKSFTVMKFWWMDAPRFETIES